VIFENSPGFTRFLKNHHFQANFTTKTHETKVKLLLLLIFETSVSKNHKFEKKTGENFELKEKRNEDTWNACIVSLK